MERQIKGGGGEQRWGEGGGRGGDQKAAWNPKTMLNAELFLVAAAAVLPNTVK